MKKYLKFEYFYIIVIIIWEPLNRFVLKMDGAGRSITILTIFLISIMMLKKYFYKIAFRKPIIIWGVWVVYAFVNTLYKGYYDDSYPMYAFFTLLFVPYILMVEITLLFKKDHHSLLSVLIFALYLAIIIFLIFDKNDSSDRAGGIMNSNTKGIMALVLLMFLYLKFFYKKLSLQYFLILSVVPFILIVSSGSRTAFLGMLLMILTHLIINRSKSTFVTLLRFVIGIGVLLLPLNYILNSTELGERIRSTTQQAEEGKNMETGILILDKFGDRGIYYYLGWEVFSENTITGIGLNNFKDYTGGEFLEQHSEYMIQLSELGIIGFGLFIFFYSSLFKRLLKLRSKRSIKTKEVELYLAYVLIILAMITVTRMFRVWYLFSVIGIVNGFIFKSELATKRMDRAFKEVSKKVIVVNNQE